MDKTDMADALMVAADELTDPKGAFGVLAEAETFCRCMASPEVSPCDGARVEAERLIELCAAARDELSSTAELIQTVLDALAGKGGEEPGDGGR